MNVSGWKNRIVRPRPAIEAAPTAARMRRVGRWAILLGCSLVCFQSTSAHELRWKLEPGGEYRVFVERTIRQKSVAADWLENVRYQLAWVVSSVDEQGQMHVVQKLVEIKHSIQLADAEPTTYDSTQSVEARGDATTLARIWKPLLQIERPFVLLPNGKTERVDAAAKDNGTITPVASTAPTIAATSSTAASAPPAATISGVPSTSSGRPAPAKLLQEGLWTLPADEVAPGTRWEEVTVVPWGEDGEALRLTSTYSYVGEQTIEQSVFDRIQVKLGFEVQPRTDGNERLILERQSGSGFVDFDANAGHLVRSEVTHELVLQLLSRTPAAGTTTAPPAFSNPVTAPTRAELSTTVKVRFQPVERPTEAPTSE